MSISNKKYKRIRLQANPSTSNEGAIQESTCKLTTTELEATNWKLCLSSQSNNMPHLKKQTQIQPILCL